jgi:hypothetical protein
MRTKTRYVDFQTLQAQGDNANTIIKLMMACNDLILADDSLSEWKKELPRSKKSKQINAQFYFVRIQLAHLHEGLKVVEEIKKNTALEKLIRDCDSQTQQSFTELEQFLPQGSKHNEMKNLITLIRHNLTFHYAQSGTMIEKAISDRSKRSDGRISSVTRGDTWHFKVADDIVDSIVVRQIWKIPREADARIEADKILDRVRQITMWFLDFSAEFIWKYCES